MYGETNFCGCGKKYPIVPGSNPSLVTWDGQKFVVADGTKQLPINLPYIQHTTKTNAPYILTTNAQGVLAKLLYSNNIPINYLLVGGGASAGDSAGGTSGGGGAGGVLSSSLNFKTGKILNISVGKGGSVPAFNSTGNIGGNSTISYSNVTLTAIGGGGGGSAGTGGSIGTPSSGGSGGGGNNGQSGASGTIGQGYAGLAGGVGTDGSSYGGGGGGAGGAGTPVQYNGSGNCLGGAGGVGIISSITGTSVYYAVGGSGNADIDGTSVGVIQTTGYGGYGSGGQSAAYGYVNSVPYTPYPGFNGVCILSIPNQYFSGAYTNATVTINGANTILTFTQNGTYTI